MSSELSLASTGGILLNDFGEMLDSMLDGTKNHFLVREQAEDLHRPALSLRASHITIGGSCFRKTIGDCIIFPGNMPEPNLEAFNLVFSQHTLGCNNQPSHS